MKVWNYYLVDDMKIRNLYIKILSKRTGQKYHRISHPTFNESLTNEIINDLMKYLSLNHRQAEWLLNSHVSRRARLKEELIELDDHKEDKKYSLFYDFIFRSKRQSAIGLWIFTILFVFGLFFLVLMITGAIAQEDYTGTLVAISMLLMSFTGFIYVYLYYRNVHLLQKDLETLQPIPIKGNIIKIRLKQHLEYFRHGLYYTCYYGVNIIIQKENKKIKLFYPFKTDDLKMNRQTYSIRRKQKEIQSKLLSIHSIDTYYFEKSKVISESILHFDKITYFKANR